MAFERTVRRPTRWAAGALAIVLCAAGLAGCGGNRSDRVYTSQEASEGGFRLFKRSPGTTNIPNAGVIGVNAYLWRASLDTLSFAPLAQADSNGGVIVTEWYVNPQNPSERAKVSVAILDRDLRADALRVIASRQTLQNGQWVDAPVTAATVQRLEEIILTRARDLRRTALTG